MLSDKELLLIVPYLSLVVGSKGQREEERQARIA